MTPSFPKKAALLGTILLAGAAGAFLAMSHPPASPAGDSRTASASERRDAGNALPAKDAAVEALLTELHSLTGQGEALDFQALQAALQSLVRKDPKSAADFASSLGDGSIREIALHRVAQAWAGRHPEAAAQWANAIRNQEERGALLNGIFCEVAQADPAKAVQMAESYDMLSFSPGMTGNLVQQWAARDYDAALRWTAGQPSGPPRDEMFVRLAMVRSTASPEEAARMISEQVAPGPAQEEAAITIVSRWAATDLEAAKAWANSFDAGAFRERALNEITLATHQAPPPKP